jgi:4-hydroxybenzoate polyprenyltransferase
MGEAAAPGLKWQVYLRLGRVSNLPTVWTNVLAGVILAGAAVEPVPLTALILAVSLFYVGGMFLNDAFDADIDARERPERPIPSGRTSRREVFAIGYGMLAAALAIVAWLATSTGWQAVLAAAALAATIVYYDAHHKANPLSPLVMGLCRVLVYILAAVAVTGRVTPPVLGGAAILLCYLIGLTYVAKQENLAEYHNLWPLAFLAAPFVYGISTLLGSAVGAVLYLGFLAWVVYAISFLVRPGPGRIPRAVISFIAGISLLDAMLIAGRGAPAAAGLAVVGFALTLFAQRYVRGT